MTINTENKFKKIQDYFLYFFFYSVIGWIYETVLEVFIYKWGFSNRGTLFGPYLPIYGVGALLFIIFLSSLMKKKIKLGPINITPVLVFIGIVVISTVAELIGSYISEAMSGSWAWDYTRFKWNFQGRIAVNPSIRFGIGGMIFMYGVQPFLEKFTTKATPQTIKILFYVLAGIMIIDIIAKQFHLY